MIHMGSPTEKRSPPEARPKASGRDSSGSSAASSTKPSLLRHREVEAVLLDHGCRPLEVEVVPVSLAECDDLLRREVRLRDQLGQIVEEVLEPRRADDLEDSARRLARVPERVPL